MFSVVCWLNSYNSLLNNNLRSVFCNQVWKPVALHRPGACLWMAVLFCTAIDWSGLGYLVVKCVEFEDQNNMLILVPSLTPAKEWIMIKLYLKWGTWQKQRRETKPNPQHFTFGQYKCVNVLLTERNEHKHAYVDYIFLKYCTISL